MVTIAIGFAFLVALMGVFNSSAFSFAEMGNYINMERRTRNALDQMSRNIRSARTLTSFDPAAIVLSFDSGGITNLSYRYDAAAKAVQEEWTIAGTKQSKTLLTCCNQCVFSLYDRDLKPTSIASPGEGKVLSIAWQCFGTTLGRTNTEQMQQAKIVIRNQP